MYDTAENDDFDREQIATYEEVAKLYPRPGIYRPIVLIGAPGVGRNELKRRLIATNNKKYKTPMPCEFSFPINMKFLILKSRIARSLLVQTSIEIRYSCGGVSVAVSGHFGIKVRKKSGTFISKWLLTATLAPSHL